MHDKFVIEIEYVVFLGRIHISKLVNKFGKCASSLCKLCSVTAQLAERIWFSLLFTFCFRNLRPVWQLPKSYLNCFNLKKKSVEWNPCFLTIIRAPHTPFCTDSTADSARRYAYSSLSTKTYRAQSLNASCWCWPVSTNSIAKPKSMPCEHFDISESSKILVSNQLPECRFGPYSHNPLSRVGGIVTLCFCGP